MKLVKRELANRLLTVALCELQEPSISGKFRRDSSSTST